MSLTKVGLSDLKMTPLELPIQQKHHSKVEGTYD